MIHLIVLRVITFLGSWDTVLGYSYFEVEEKHKASEINPSEISFKTAT